MSQLNGCLSVSRPHFYVVTPFLLLAILIPGLSFFFRLRLKIAGVLFFFFLVTTWALGRDQVVSLITAILVATSKVCHDHSSFLSSRNLIFDVQQFPINSSSFFGRNLESVSRLSSGPSYFVFVAVAQT